MGEDARIWTDDEIRLYRRSLMGWVEVSFTPEGGESTAFGGVSSVHVDGRKSRDFVSYGGRSWTILAPDTPHVVVNSSDLATIKAHAVGTVGTFRAVHEDAKAGIVRVTLTNAVVAASTVIGTKGTLILEASPMADGSSPMRIEKIESPSSWRDLPAML